LPDERHVLYSFVPKRFVKLADEGVLANPEHCIQWLDINGAKKGKD
jgi:hypothetical protein